MYPSKFFCRFQVGIQCDKSIEKSQACWCKSEYIHLFDEDTHLHLKRRKVFQGIIISKRNAYRMVIINTRDSETVTHEQYVTLRQSVKLFGSCSLLCHVGFTS